MSGTKLVMGASGFLGSHVTRQLVERGDDVRVWIRQSSSTAAFDDLDVERHFGELEDDAALREAMKDVDTVFYCIVDTRAWLRDPTPLYATNVESLRHALDAAVEVGVPKFVFCSTVGTIASTKSGVADETMPHNWRRLGGDYIESRIQAEDLVLQYHREQGPASHRAQRRDDLRAGRPRPYSAWQPGAFRCSGQDACVREGRLDGGGRHRGRGRRLPPGRGARPGLVSGTSSPKGSCPTRTSSTSRPTRAVSRHRGSASRIR